MSLRALPIGGTGPTSPYVIDGLLKRGYRVSILHRGVHEVELPAEVEHIHPYPHPNEAWQKSPANIYNGIVLARTAHAALEFLGHLRQCTKLAIPLAWDPYNVTETCAIEVYPTATRIAMGIKKENQLSEIRKDGRISIEVSEKDLASEHAKDAVVCVLSAMDFLLDKCVPPTSSEKELAEKEGWIWVRGGWCRRGCG